MGLFKTQPCAADALLQLNHARLQSLITLSSNDFPFHSMGTRAAGQPLVFIALQGSGRLELSCSFGWQRSWRRTFRLLCRLRKSSPTFNFQSSPAEAGEK